MTPSTMKPAPLLDQSERDLITTALDDTLVVEAAAGTGKTTELTRRIVAVLESGRATLDRVVAVTFTEAAAGELKLRLRVAIEEARLDPTRPKAARQRLVEALPKLEEARIGTIHSFCADLLRERPVEAGVDPQFEVAAEEASRRLFDGAFAAWFEGQLSGAGPGVRRILRRWKREPFHFGRARTDGGPRELLRNAARSLVQQRHFPAPWRRDPGFERDETIDRLVEEMEDLAARAADGEPADWFTKSLVEIGKFVDEVRRAERVRERDYDWLEARFTDIIVGKQKNHWTWKGSRFSEEFPPSLRERRDALYRDLQAFSAASGADLAPLLRDELWPVVDAYEYAKEKIGCLDFDDLLIRTGTLLRRDAGVRAELQKRFTHFFVDEFQDTDPLQTEVLMLLASDDPSAVNWRTSRFVPGKLFLVGDPKQSIYRFRRADVALYREVQEILLAQGARRVTLTVSFRSIPGIQDAVNAAFEERMSQRGVDGYQAPYVPLQRFRESSAGQPALIALPVPAPYSDWKRIVEWRIDESQPDVTAAWIHWLVTKSGWAVTERERPDVRVPIEARHVCLLFRRFRSFGADVTRPYREALEARGLSHLLVGGTALHEREEVEAIRNALAAIERPDDELSVFATLRGPLVALSDASLVLWRDRVGPLHPFRPVPEELPEALHAVAQALALLRDLHRGRNRRSVAQTIVALLEATRAHAAFAIWPSGMQALANVSRLLDLARRAEQEGLVSFRSFLDRLEEDAEYGEGAEGPMLEEGIEGVRIMTVHKAKGLEFPVVVLADMNAKETMDQPSRWTDSERGLCVQRIAGCTPVELRERGVEEQERDREEALRLLYVASTRARDLLVVPVIGDERRESWIAALWSAIYPTTKGARNPIAEGAPGCPSFGEDSVPGRPLDMRRPFGSVKPGIHQPERGGHHVVWWDPASLELGIRHDLDRRQMRILEEDGEGRAGAAGAAYARWKKSREDTRARGGAPTRVVAPATEWAETHPDIRGADRVEVVETERAATRPRGRRFGTLVHAVLSGVGLDDDASRVEAYAAAQARLLGASDLERDAAAGAVRAALAHPLIRRAAAAAKDGRCRREAPLTVRMEDGTLLESVVDLAFLEDGSWQVVDFKSDPDLERLLEGYRRQVALYAAGITQATGLPTKGTILHL